MRPSRFSLAILLGLLMPLISSCDDDSFVSPRENLRVTFGLEAINSIPYPPDNPPNMDRIELGRLLFFDPVLSGTGEVSCGHCHHPAFAWGDGRALAIGVSGEVPGIGPAGVGPDRVITDPDVLVTPRNSPTCLNAACSSQPNGTPHFLGLQFWDGRADGLEEQSTLPITSFDEMRGDAYTAEQAMDMVIQKLRAIPEYMDLFEQAFPFEAANWDCCVIQESTYARALSAYQRELIALESPFDEYVAGNDWALNDSRFNGLRLFFGKAGCGGCHNGPMLSSYEFAVTGVAQAGPGREAIVRGGDGMDWGRFEHTGVEADKFAFRVPSLRNVGLTGPYMRTGEYTNLREVVEFYVEGGNDAGLDPDLIDPRIRPLDLSEGEIDQLVAFLESLSDRSINSRLVDPTVPLAVPSGLTPTVPWAPFSRVP